MAGYKLDTLQARIKARLSSLNINAAQASRRAGRGKDLVQEILRGRHKNPSSQVISDLATALDCTVAYLTGDSDNPYGSIQGREWRSSLPVVGTVEAGVFRVMNSPEPWAHEDEYEHLSAPTSSAYPTSRAFLFKVSGNSMNNARPLPIVDGDYVCCIDVIETGLDIVDDEIYVVRRTQDGGQSYEWTLKRARVFRDRIELKPESTDPRHQPIILDRRAQSADGKEVVAIGLVYATFRPISRYA